MNPLAAVRARVPEMALVMACIMTAGAVGFSLGVHSWLPYVALAAVSILAAGAGLRLASHRNEPPPKRGRARQKALPGGKTAATYDLAEDQSTNNQRYLM